MVFKAGSEYRKMIEFKEEQRFTQWWLWLILLAIGIIPVFGIYEQMINNRQFGDKPLSDSGLILFAVFIFGLISLFFLLKLKTEISSTGIKMTFSPFAKMSIPWTDIKSAKIVKYGFVGYGIRFGSSYGTVYNTKGDLGLAIETRSGERFVIGTQKQDELNKLVQKYFIITDFPVEQKNDIL
jgi:hypothetical protein